MYLQVYQCLCDSNKSESGASDLVQLITHKAGRQQIYRFLHERRNVKHCRSFIVFYITSNINIVYVNILI